jgi:hypothetical protein
VNSVVSSINSQNTVQDGCDAAYKTLAAAFGEPTPVSTGFRWSVTKAGTGSRAMVELTFPVGGGRLILSPVVWIFDPDAIGISTFSSVDVNTSDGLMWLKSEVQRLGGALS